MSLPASVLMAMKPQMSFQFLELAAFRRRLGLIEAAKSAVLCSRLFEKPRLP